MSFVPVVVFADIDEGFLATDVSNGAARTGEILDRENIVPVLCSHMTRVELDVWQQHLGIAHPFICESGAAVLISHGYFPFEPPHDRDLAGHHVIEFGRSYLEVVELLHRTARRVHVDVVGFSDMSVEQVATAYDLSLSRARLAKLREYDEPVRVINGRDGARERLLRSLYAAGLVSNYQGAYDHIGAAVDKGTSVKLLTALFRRTFGPLITIGVGSTTNSAALLRSVDVPFIVASDRAAPDLQELPRIPRLHLTPGVVPWIEAIGEIARQTRETHDRVRTLG